MPLPADERILALSQELLREFERISGQHPGFRPMHARGLLLRGTFQPTRAAAVLSRAPHFNQPETPVTVRFSNFSGIPTTPDNDPDADPHGCALRFHLAEHTHTDIISHSTPYFPAGNRPAFLAMFQAFGASNSPQADESPLAAYLRTHPAARAFMERPKPVPASYARKTYSALGGQVFEIAAWEAIHTESSYKFTLPQITELAVNAGLRVVAVFQDNAHDFADVVLAVDELST